MKREILFIFFFFILLTSNLFAQQSASKNTKNYRFSVKLIPFPDKQRANATIKELKDLGYSPYLEHRKIDNTIPVFIVTVKDFFKLKEAETFLNDFISKTGEFAYITKYNTLDIVKTGSIPLIGKKNKPRSKKRTPTSTKIAQPPSPSTITSPPLTGSIEEKIAQLEQRLNKLQKEAEARKKLEIPEEEKKKKEEKILEAAGREYLLLPKGRLSLEYSLGYSYYSYDTLESIYEVEHHANHNFRNTISTEYAVLNNLTLTFNIPFVYKYDKVGTHRERKVTDIGDISFGVKFQPFKNTGKWPAPIFSSSLILPTGRSPYSINIDDELSTGGGLVGISNSVSVSKPLDPVNAFASLGFSYFFEKDGINQRRGGDILVKVKPRGGISGSLGIGYALSYNVSLSLSYSYSYSLGTKYYFKSGRVTQSGTSVSSSLGISTGWYITPKRSIIIGTGIGLTNNDSDFSFSLRIPFSYDLVK